MTVTTDQQFSIHYHMMKWCHHINSCSQHALTRTIL